MQHIEVRRRFNAPPEKVWEIYTDHAGWKEWAGFSDSWLETQGSPDRNGVGCLRGFSGNGVTVFEEVTEFEAPRRMVYRVVRGGIPMRDHEGTVELLPDGDGTELIWRCRFESRIPGLGWLMKIVVTKVFRDALAGLERRKLR
jgi:uncharacterized protein YndB with AHSA1/START domain